MWSPHAITRKDTKHARRVQRLVKDFKAMQSEPPTGVDASPDPNNIMRWRAAVFGPDGTIWEDGIFKLSLEFTESYPQAPPTVKFVSRVYHPNGARAGTTYHGNGCCVGGLARALLPQAVRSAAQMRSALEHLRHAC
jgi:Ubiquitin-conjugating enzyme